MRLRSVVLVVGFLAASVAVLLACNSTSSTSASGGAGSSPEADVPLAARTVWAGTYDRDIQPIFDQYCVGCHGPSRAENGLRLDSYEHTLTGTQYGPVIIPGSPETSTLMAVIQGRADSKISMPHEGRRLTPNRIQNIQLWIAAGAPE